MSKIEIKEKINTLETELECIIHISNLKKDLEQAQNETIEVAKAYNELQKIANNRSNEVTKLIRILQERDEKIENQKSELNLFKIHSFKEIKAWEEIKKLKVDLRVTIKDLLVRLENKNEIIEGKDNQISVLAKDLEQTRNELFAEVKAHKCDKDWDDAVIKQLRDMVSTERILRMKS